MFSQVNGCKYGKTYNNLQGQALEDKMNELTRWFVHFFSSGSNTFAMGNACKGNSPTTIAAKLAAKGAWSSNYRNGSYVSQATSTQINFPEAGLLEQRAPLTIATFWPGHYAAKNGGSATSTAARLGDALGAGETTVRVSVATVRPSGTPTTWPFMNSRGSGLNPQPVYSQQTRDFVSWIRIGDEMMQIVQPPVENGGRITLTVRRGIWGTAATNHAAQSRVLAPVYIGSDSQAPADQGLSGVPSRNDPKYALRYGIKIWKPAGHGFIANRIKDSFGPGLQGYNAIWLDTSSCINYGNGDGLGKTILPWDDDHSAVMTKDQWGRYQKVKLAGLREALPGIKFAGNNQWSHYDACTDDLIANSYDGPVLEGWMRTDHRLQKNWNAGMAQHFRIQNSNWPAVYWLRWDHDFAGNQPAYRRFAYGAYLLGYRSSNVKTQFGGTYDLTKPEELFFWNWGAPTGGTPSSLSDVAVPGMSGVFRRNFAKGVVVVNQSNSTVNYNLGAGTYYDVVNKDQNGQPRQVSQVKIPSRDAAFLLNPS